MYNIIKWAFIVMLVLTWVIWFFLLISGHLPEFEIRQFILLSIINLAGIAGYLIMQWQQDDLERYK